MEIKYKVKDGTRDTMGGPCPTSRSVLNKDNVQNMLDTCLHFFTFFYHVFLCVCIMHACRNTHVDIR